MPDQTPAGQFEAILLEHRNAVNRGASINGLNEAKLALEQLFNQQLTARLQAELEAINNVTPIVEDYKRNDKYYFERGYALVKKLEAIQAQMPGGGTE